MRCVSKYWLSWLSCWRSYVLHAVMTFSVSERVNWTWLLRTTYVITDLYEINSIRRYLRTVTPFGLRQRLGLLNALRDRCSSTKLHQTRTELDRDRKEERLWMVSRAGITSRSTRWARSELAEVSGAHTIPVVTPLPTAWLRVIVSAFSREAWVYRVELLTGAYGALHGSSIRKCTTLRIWVQ